MSGRPVVLNTLKGGINRLRVKGGASQQVLYDLLNGYVTADNSIESRPGTENHATLPTGTKGLCAFDGGFVVFASSDPGAMPSGYTCEILTHPTAPGTALLDIHFAGPMLGYLYVVAEFADEETFHYWLQRRDDWAALTAYNLGDVVEPTTPNGYAYRATRLNPAGVLWAPNVPRAMGDRIEPTTANGFVYEVTAVAGASPKSGATEPDWPAEDGATVIEDTDITPTAPAGTGVTDVDLTLPPSIEDRYSGTMGGYLIRGVTR
jgi:hypothetical protein